MNGSPACGGVVTFDYLDWIAQYPEFGYVTSTQAQAFFNRVTIGGPVDNTPASPIQNLQERTILLNAATAHMAKLFAPNPSAPGTSGIVGRVSAATEGSVSVTAEYTIPTGRELAAWWNQTTYGAYYYAATLRYRTAFYAPPPYRPALGACGFPFRRRGF